MPKETISTPVGPYHVKVGWRAGHEVQVGVEGEGQRSLFWILLNSSPDSLRQLGAQAREFVDLSTSSDEEVAIALLNTMDIASGMTYQGVWSDLDRKGCNDLIRVLRRARDQAFGGDE